MKVGLISSAVAEAATGLALLIVPSLVGLLLFGVEFTGTTIPVARVAGIALIGLGIACWPGPPLVGMLIYSAAVTLYLSHVGFAVGLTGVFLWPAVVVHAILTALLARDVIRTRLAFEPTGMIANIRRGAQSCAYATKHSAMVGSLCLLLAVGLIGPAAMAHGPAAKNIRLAQATTEFGVLKGRWVRPDGGYVIVIKNVDASGKVDATYFNPNPINVSKAEASQEGGALKVFLELRGAGYPGSTYTLRYEPSSDSLIGVYFQAVMQQKFDVVFQRAK